MRIDVLTLFPQVFEPFLGTSIVGRAFERGLIDVQTVNIRDFAKDRHRSADDRPFGGGPGMVLSCGPIFDAVEAVESRHTGRAIRVLLTPQGEVLKQSTVVELAKTDWLLLICGHYEGFDERIRVGLEPREVSIGDYVLSGGEPAAMVLIDAIVRLLPGALGHEDSARDESFSAGELEYPQYTRPRVFRDMAVPEVLLSGNHQEIEAWRRAEARSRTRRRRPDLIAGDDPAEERNETTR